MAEGELSRWRSLLDAAEARADSELMLFEGTTFAVRREGYRRMGPARPLSVWQFFKIAYLLPRSIGDSLLFAYAVVRYAVRRAKGALGR